MFATRHPASPALQVVIDLGFRASSLFCLWGLGLFGLHIFFWNRHAGDLLLFACRVRMRVFLFFNLLGGRRVKMMAKVFYCMKRNESVLGFNMCS